MSTLALQEAKELIERAQSGDERALDRITQSNMGLVHMAARRFMGRGVEYEDLAQIGALGLVKAIKRFDTAHEVAFSTYAVPVIMGEIKRFFRDTGSIKVSRRLKELSNKCMRCREELTRKLGREPTISELSQLSGADASDIASAIEIAQPMLSFDEEFGEEEGASLSCFLGSDKSDELLQSIALKEALEKLSEKERRLVSIRFFSGKTQTETARVLGVSQVQISRLERAVITKLRAFFAV